MLSPKVKIGIPVLLSLLLLSACSESTNSLKIQPEYLTVETTHADEAESYQAIREYAGVVKAKNKASLGSELSGKIATIFIDVGEKVSRGQKLARLDTQLLETEQKNLEAKLREVKAQLKLTKANLKRLYSLNKKGFISQSEIDSLHSQKDVFLAKITSIESSLMANKLQIQKSTIRASYSGIISERFVSVGHVISAGMPIFELLSSKGKEAVIGLFKEDVETFTLQDNYSVRVGKEIYPSKLISLPANIEAGSRNVRLRFQFQQANHLLDGELAYLIYPKRIQKKGFWLPNTALIDGLRGTWNIYLLKDVDGHKVVKSRSVQIIYSGAEKVYVKGALTNGDEVVTSGLHKVVPEQIVQAAKMRTL